MDIQNHLHYLVGIIIFFGVLLVSMILVGVYNTFFSSFEYRIKEHDGFFYPQMKRGLFENWCPVLIGDGPVYIEYTIYPDLALQAIKKHYRAIQSETFNKPVYHKIDIVTLD